MSSPRIRAVLARAAARRFDLDARPAPLFKSRTSSSASEVPARVVSRRAELDARRARQIKLGTSTSASEVLARMAARPTDDPLGKSKVSRRNPLPDIAGFQAKSQASSSPHSSTSDVWIMEATRSASLADSLPNIAGPQAKSQASSTIRPRPDIVGSMAKTQASSSPRASTPDIWVTEATRSVSLADPPARTASHFAFLPTSKATRGPTATGKLLARTEATLGRSRSLRRAATAPAAKAPVAVTKTTTLPSRGWEVPPPIKGPSKRVKFAFPIEAPPFSPSSAPHSRLPSILKRPQAARAPVTVRQTSRGARFA
ncbi:hypothetical protein MMC30_000286 [Trapelia coarctata]|nr:hypothetical protein [Trapelia coarctata]